VAQYPAVRELRLQNESVRFLDGTLQRYRDYSGLRMRWVIRLDLLDEGEIAAIEEFFGAVEGRYTTFTFTDPWDGEEYTGCRLDADTAEMVAVGEMQNSTILTVTQ
jgi:hypothetical protein